MLITASLISWVLLVLAPAGECNDDEDKLINDLLDGYQKYGRPGKKDDPVEVSYGISLLRIIKYDLETDTASFDVWEYFQWTDDRLDWDESEYKVSSIRLPHEVIWVPDLTPYNGWDEKKQLTSIVVYPNGKCAFVPKKIWSIPCWHNKTAVECSIKVGSWTYDGSMLNVTARSDEIDVSLYNPYYQIIENKAVRNVMRYECCPEPYIDITFYLSFSLKDEKKP